MQGHGLIAVAPISWEDTGNMLLKAVEKSQRHANKMIPRSNL